MVETLDDAWTSEPLPGEERARWNPDAPAWRAWNRMSPEYEFCELVGALVGAVKPALVIETGVGQGFATRRIAANLPRGSVLRAFESDEAWRARLASLTFFDGETVVLSDEPTPADDELATADLFVADSGFKFRFDEVSRWAQRAKKGAYIVVHDTGHGHPGWTRPPQAGRADRDARNRRHPAAEPQGVVRRPAVSADGSGSRPRAAGP